MLRRQQKNTLTFVGINPLFYFLIIGVALKSIDKKEELKYT